MVAFFCAGAVGQDREGDSGVFLSSDDLLYVSFYTQVTSGARRPEESFIEHDRLIADLLPAMCKLAGNMERMTRRWTTMTEEAVNGGSEALASRMRASETGRLYIELERLS